MSALDRRAALARAALAVAVRDGVAAASTRAIVAEAGMPLGSFHYAVPSREELLRDVVALVVEGERAAATAVPDAADLTAAIRAALAGYLESVRREPGREQAMFELTQHALRSSALGDLPAEQYGRYREAVSALLVRSAEQHGVSWDLPLDDLARLVVALTDGLTLSWLADRDDPAAERMLDLAAAAIVAHARAGSETGA